MIKILLSCIQAAEIRFLQSLWYNTLQNKIDIGKVCKAMIVELLFQLERPHLQWFGNVTGMPTKYW